MTDTHTDVEALRAQVAAMREGLGLPEVTWPFSRKQWFALPLTLRQRWWRETDYSRLAPSRELLATVMKELGL